MGLLGVELGLDSGEIFHIAGAEKFLPTQYPSIITSTTKTSTTKTSTTATKVAAKVVEDGSQHQFFRVRLGFQ